MTHADPQSGAGWYVVYTKPRQEQTARQNLLDQAFEVWLPLMGKWVRRRGERLCVSEPMFPRYLFLRPTRSGQSLAPVRSTPGAVGLVRFGARSPTLDERTLAALRALERQSYTEPGLPQPGTRVRVVAGPLTGIEALVSASATQRVEIFLTLLGRDTRVSLSPDAVDTLPE